MELFNLTEPRRALPKRRYDDACGAAHGLELVGDRWALLVVRELMFGPKRFGDLRVGLSGISANVLSQRLLELEGAGLLVRRKLPPPTSSRVYELTPWGYEAEPIIQMLGRWAARSPLHDPTLPISAASLLLSFRTMLDRDRARAFDARIGFRFGDESFLGHLSARGFAIARGDPAAAVLTFAGEPAALAATVYGGQPLAALERGGALRIEGNRALAERFVTLFPLPEKAG